jgi:hypothetical protein
VIAKTESDVAFSCKHTGERGREGGRREGGAKGAREGEWSARVAGGAKGTAAIEGEQATEEGDGKREGGRRRRMRRTTNPETVC